MPSDDNPKYERVGFLRLAGVDQCAGRRLALPDYRTGLSSTCNATTEIRERFWINRSGHIVAREMSPGFLSVGAGGSGQEDRFDSSR